MLSYVNLILVVLIIGVVCVDTYYLIQTRKDISDIRQKMMDGSSMIDLAEFSGLDPELKKQYRKFIVTRAMPPLMRKINKSAEDTRLVDYLNKNEYEVNQKLKEVVNSF